MANRVGISLPLFESLLFEKDKKHGQRFTEACNYLPQLQSSTTVSPLNYKATGTLVPFVPMYNLFKAEVHPTVPSMCHKLCR